MSATILSEVWRPIPGFEGRYEVSNLGRVRGVTRAVPYRKTGRMKKWPGKIISPNVQHHGHLRVSLFTGAGKKTRWVHRLVLEVFVGPCPPGMEARHFPDRNPANNRVENLSWATKKMNQGDKVVHGTLYCGGRHWKARLTEETVAEIRRLYRPNSRTASAAALAAKFGVGKSTIEHIINRRTWRNVK